MTRALPAAPPTPPPQALSCHSPGALPALGSLKVTIWICICAPDQSRTSTLVPTSRNLTSMAASALKPNPRAPGSTGVPVPCALPIIGGGRGVVVRKRAGPAAGGAWSVAREQTPPGARRGRKIVKQNVGAVLGLGV